MRSGHEEIDRSEMKARNEGSKHGKLDENNEIPFPDRGNELTFVCFAVNVEMQSQALFREEMILADVRLFQVEFQGVVQPWVPGHPLPL